MFLTPLQDLDTHPCRAAISWGSAGLTLVAARALTLAHTLYPVTRTAHTVICWDRTQDAQTAHVNRTQRGRSRLCGGTSDGLPYGRTIWREGRLGNLSSKLSLESQKGRCGSRYAQETLLTGRQCLSENKEVPSENPLPIFFRWL